MKRLVLIFLTGMTAFAVMAGGYKGTPYKWEPHKVPGIIEAEDFDNGGERISWHPFKNKTVHISDATVKIEAEDYNDGGYHYAWFKKPSSKNIGNDKKYRKSDVAMSISKEDNNRYVSELKKGEWVRYTIEVNKGGEFLISFVARSIKNKGNSKLHISSNGHNISGELTISGNDWQTIDVPSVKLPAGTQYLEFRIDAGDIDFDNFSITKF